MTTDPQPNENTFGEKLKMLRKAKKYTLKEVEAITGISNAYLSQVENGKILKPSPDKLFELAEAYGVDFDQLMYESGHLEKNPVTQPGQPKTLMGAALSSKNLTPEEEAKLAEYLEFLRSRK